MAVPTSGILYLEKLAREAYYGDYNGSQNVGTVSLFDIVNGGQAKGSTLNYPTINRDCLPNPTGSLTNDATEPCSQGLDVCFIIDYTGSMGGVIETVKDGLADVIAHINTESSSNYRLSMITVDEVGGEGGGSTPNYASCTQYTSLPTAQKYSNQGSSGLYQIITAWEMFPPFSTNNSTSFTTAVDNLNGGVSGSSCIQLGSGVGTPEPMDIGLGLVINSTNFVNDFRSTAAKYIIMITDAPPGGGDDAFTQADYDALQVLTATSIFRGIKVFVLGLGVNSNITVSGTVRYPWRELAVQTGGTWNTTYDTTDVEADITVACDENGAFTPYKFSAWYGYDKDCTSGIKSFNSSTVQTSESNACSSTINQTYYHNGSLPGPGVGNTCYINQNQTTVLAAGYYLTSSNGGIRITGTSGVVASSFTCSTLYTKPTTALAYPKPIFACGQTMNTTRWYTSNTPTIGTTVYTNSSGTATLIAGNYAYDALLAEYYFTVNSSGVITSINQC
jgi:hypothetical protein